MLKLILPQGSLFTAFDYGRTFTFKLYLEDSTTFDATGYTPYIRFFDEDAEDIVQEIQGIWTSQNQGVGTFAFSSSKRLTAFSGNSGTAYYMKVLLEKSGTVISTERRKITIFEGSASPRTP